MTYGSLCDSDRSQQMRRLPCVLDSVQGGEQRAGGSYWNKVLRIGPNPRTKGGQWPDVYTYFLTVQCQHCENPECVKVCPTGASHKLEDGTVQIDKSKCIGCQFCAMSCPYRGALPQRGGARRGEVHLVRAEDRSGRTFLSA